MTELDQNKKADDVEKAGGLKEKTITFIKDRYHLGKSTRWDAYVDYHTTIGYFAQADGASELAVLLGILTKDEADEIKKSYEGL